MNVFSVILTVMSGWPTQTWRWYAGVLAACVAASFLPGIVGMMFEPGDWYAHLAKSSLTPPGWVFPIAWTLLYALMAVAMFVVIVCTSPDERRVPIGVFALQLVLNGLWSWLFFGRQDIVAGLVEIILLWLAIVATIATFWRTSRIAAALLVPYLAWVSFATYLTFAIWRANDVRP